MFHSWNEVKWCNGLNYAPLRETLSTCQAAAGCVRVDAWVDTLNDEFRCVFCVYLRWDHEVNAGAISCIIWCEYMREVDVEINQLTLYIKCKEVKCTKCTTVKKHEHVWISEHIPVYLQKPLVSIITVFSHSNPASDFDLRGLIYIHDWSVYVNLHALLNSQYKINNLQLLTQPISGQAVACLPSHDL